MDTNDQIPDRDLSQLEQRLSGWYPARENLSAEAMLFEAGRASARRGRAGFIWPVFAAMMTLVTVVLSGWVVAERTERLAMARQVHDRSMASRSAPAPKELNARDAATSEELSPYSYLASYRLLEETLDRDPAKAPGELKQNQKPPQDGPHVLQAWDRASLPDR